MHIKSIEPTPSPNTMKVILDQELPFGTAHNYNKTTVETAPEIIQEIMQIDGVKGIYHVADFLAVERIGKFDWETILIAVRQVFGEEAEATSTNGSVDHFGEAYVHVQMFNGIPLQVKVFDNMEEKRFGLSKRFVDAFSEAMKDDENYIMQRKWVDYGVRYGDKEEVGISLVQELEAAFPDNRIEELVTASRENRTVPTRKRKISLEEFQVDDWEKRFQLLDQIPDPELDDIPLLEAALRDEKMSIRRLATVYFGMIENTIVVPYLIEALKDKSASVRRTAGDCMSDLSFVEFEPAMQEALTDKNKLVRWRAAMFLYETGTEASLPALEEASNDKEFEVKLQIKMAIERITQGEDAKGSMWRQMTEMRQNNKK